MNKQTRGIINNVLDLLSDEQKKEDLVEINEKKHKMVYDFLNKQGHLNIDYSVRYNGRTPIFSEKESNIDLWYKSSFTIWSIDVFRINKILKANWVSDINK